MVTLTGVLYEGDGFIRRGLAKEPVSIPASRQEAKAEVLAEVRTDALAPSVGIFELEVQARALRREYVNQWFRSLFDK